MGVFVQKLAVGELPATAAAGTLIDTVLGEAPFAATVTEVTLIPEAALTASDSVYRTLTIYNRGAAGAGTTVVATLVTNLAGGNWTAADEKAFTLSATAANLVLAAGDVLECVETVASTGTVRPQCEITVSGTRI